MSFSAGRCSGLLALLLTDPTAHRPYCSPALLVLAVFLPELLAQLRVGFRHGCFANLLGDHVIVTAIGHVGWNGAGAGTGARTTTTACTGAGTLAAASRTLATGLPGTARLGALAALTTSTRAPCGTTGVGLHAAVLAALAAFAIFAISGVTVAGRARTVARGIGPGTRAIARRSGTRGPVRRQHLLFRPDAAVKNAQRFIDAPQDGLAPVRAARLRTTATSAAGSTCAAARLSTCLRTRLTTRLSTWLATTTRGTSSATASLVRACSAATGSASGLPCRGRTTLSGSTRRLR